MNAASLTSAFTAPADFRFESCSPESGLSELDGALELDGLELGPELQFLLESHMSQSPTHSDSHLLDSLDKVRSHAPSAQLGPLNVSQQMSLWRGSILEGRSTAVIVSAFAWMHDLSSLPASVPCSAVLMLLARERSPISSVAGLHPLYCLDHPPS